MTIAVEPGALVHLRDEMRGRKYRGERGRQPPAEKYSGKRTGPGKGEKGGDNCRRKNRTNLRRKN